MGNSQSQIWHLYIQSSTIHVQLVQRSSFPPLLRHTGPGFRVGQRTRYMHKDTVIRKLAVHPATSSLWQRLPFISCPVLSISRKTFIWQLLYETIQANLHVAQQSCLLLKDFNGHQELFMSLKYSVKPQIQQERDTVNIHSLKITFLKYWFNVRQAIFRLSLNAFVRKKRLQKDVTVKTMFCLCTMQGKKKKKKSKAKQKSYL